METWLRISILLCTFGFFRELRPSEPFVAEYFTGEQWHNITIDQVYKELYPVGTYAIFAQLVIVFLVTDILRYKPIIILSACAGIILFAILLWTKEIWELQIGQIFYGTFTASEVAYYTYIYAKVNKKQYQLVTGHTRAAILCGKFLGGVLAQVLISTDLMDYRELHFISFGTQIVSLFIAIILPPVKMSLYFYNGVENTENSSNNIQLCKGDNTGNTGNVIQTNSNTEIAENTSKNSPTFSWRNASGLLLKHTINAYTNPIVLQWSLWWAFATCGQLQVISYIQILWKDIANNDQSYYNGGVEATVTLLGACAALTAGIMNSNRYKEWHIWILTICSLLMGSYLIISAITNILWVAYAMYILFGTFYFFVITIASSIVAENLSDDSFGLIFGINTLIALLLQTLLTIVVVTDQGLGLDTRTQYIIYGGYFIILAVFYCLTVLIRYLIRTKLKIYV